jgi:hypothetical protein
LATTLFLASPPDFQQPSNLVAPQLLESDGYYWFLYRYFESANLQRQADELIDLCGGRLIEGYQLHRLRRELKQALEDITHKEDRWKVLTGWNGEKVSLETEVWQEVEKSKMIELVLSLCALADGASDSLSLVCYGD